MTMNNKNIIDATNIVEAARLKRKPVGDSKERGPANFMD